MQQQCNNEAQVLYNALYKEYLAQIKAENIRKQRSNPTMDFLQKKKAPATVVPYKKPDEAKTRRIADDLFQRVKTSTPLSGIKKPVSPADRQPRQFHPGGN